MTETSPLKPGDTIGILGSGQLGKMLSMAAAQLGLKTHIYCPDEGPAFDVCAAKTRAQYDDEAALVSFARSVDVITYEFENVPATTAAILARHHAVVPNADVLAITQDRLNEKTFLKNLSIPTAPFLAVDDAGSLARAVGQFGRPSILKTRRFGYDGKGQALIKEGTDLAVAFRSLGGHSTILEGFVPFAREVSVIAARGHDGSFRAYDVCENHHEHHILSQTILPARIKTTTQEHAISITQTIAKALNYVGIMTVEMFVVETKDLAGGVIEHLIVNEIAPRVHNSGHWTLDGAMTSQFEQHIRAICGWPLGSTERTGPIEMRNLIGSDVDQWPSLLAENGACLHLYGKSEARAGRKMGHVTFLRAKKDN
jgi:5-(carboxyamino)imidazole ribonucleotide synthase